MKYTKILALLAAVAMFAGCEEEKTPAGGDTPEEVDYCPDDEDKTLPGVCGCGKLDDDSDGDTVPDCYDVCSEDALKVSPGICGCGTADEVDEATGVVKCLASGDVDLCPEDDAKMLPGVCGCGKADADADGDGVMDCLDLCPDDPNKTTPGICGCSESDEDADGDGFLDCQDKCKLNAEKVLPGLCGCDAADTAENVSDSDGDGTINCLDLCPNNPNKTAPGEHGCESGDSDGDGVDDVDDACPFNPKVTKSGSDCNIVEENGAKVFELYSAAEFIALRKAIEENLPEHMLGLPCDPKKVTDTCLENTQSATKMLTCGKDAVTGLKVYMLKDCYSGCVQMDPSTPGICVAGSAPAEKPPASCTQTDSPSKLYDCCSAENFATQCGGSEILECREGMVRIKSSCAGSTPVCHEAACVKYIPIADDESNKGQINTQCDANVFKSKCDGSSMLVCRAERVQKIDCVNGCSLDEAEGSEPLCIEDTPRNDKPVLTIRLMKDINLADGFEVKTDNWGCFGDWSPISLINMKFDGGGHKVSFSKDGKQCSLTRPFFDYVRESSVDNVSFLFNVQGESSAAVAHMGVRSKFSRIKYDGGIKLGTSILGESRGEVFGILGYSSHAFGTLLSAGYRVDLEDVEVNGSFSSLASYAASGLVANGTTMRIDTGKVSFSQMDCGKMECAGAVHMGDLANARKLDVDIKSVKAGTGFWGVGKYFGSVSSSSVTIGDISGNDGVTASMYGMVGTCHSSDTTYFVNNKVKIDKVKLNGSFFGVAGSVSQKMLDQTVELGEIEAATVTGLGGISRTTERLNYSLTSALATTGNCFGASSGNFPIKDSKINIGTVTSAKGNAYGGISAMLDHVEVKIGSVESSEKEAMACGDNMNAEIKDSSISVGKVTSPLSNAYGFAKTLQGSIKNSSIDFGEVSAVKGIAYGMAATTTNTLEMQNTQVKSKLLHGTKAWGLCDTCAIVKLDYVGFDLGEVKASVNATPAAALMRIHNGNAKNVAGWNNVAHYATYYALKAQPHIATTGSYIKFSNFLDASRQFTVTAFEADGRPVSPTYQGAINIIGTTITGTMATNGYWLKRKDGDKIVGKLTGGMTGFVSTEIDTVISKFAGANWVKKTFTEDEMALVLPWPDKP